MEDIFTPDNTEWVVDRDDRGHESRHLVYVGSIEELSEETGLDEDTLYEMLNKYEDESRDWIEDWAETQREIDEARKGQY